MAGIYFGARMFGRLTVGIREFEELQKGNVAVGIFMAAVIACIAISMRAGVLEFAHGMQPRYAPLLLLLAAINLPRWRLGSLWLCSQSLLRLICLIGSLLG
ncbi:DUF350 domain-containing protein [Candidatus Micrarchaeota archaeon]|nr:DUF350 domain-containing protein [Candidatus Micrarchaeota archaeon]